MLGRTFAAALAGIDAHLVEIEVNVSGRAASPTVTALS